MSLRKRLTTLDVLRGYFLFIIIVDHVELYPSGFDFLSGRGRLWVSAAEGFFFISGLLVSYIYRRKLHLGFLFVWRKMWRRAAQLYVCTIALTLLFTYWALASGDIGIKYGLPTTINWPYIVQQTLLLRFSFGWADFLPHYVIFMLVAPFVFYLLSKGKWWLVAAASALVWHNRGSEFTAAWQTVFIGGMIAGYYWQSLQEWVMHWSSRAQRLGLRGVYIAASTSFVISYASVFLLSELNVHIATLPAWAHTLTQHWDHLNTITWPFFEKWTMEPGRLLMFGLWFSALYIWCERHASLIRRLTKGTFDVLGRNSLFVYGLHALVIFIMHLAVRNKTNFWQNLLITGGVLGIIWVVTYFKENLSKIDASQKTVSSPASLQLSPHKTEGEQ